VPTNAAAERAQNASSLPEDPLAELFSEARQLLARGETNAVLRLLEESFEAPEFTESRPQIYGAITSVMLMEGRIEEVKTRLARDFKADPGLSSPCIGAVRFHYLRQGDRDSAHAWVEHLLHLGLEDSMPVRLRAWQCEEYLRRGDFDRVLELIGAMLEKLPQEAAGKALMPIVQSYCEAAAREEHVAEYAGHIKKLLDAGVPPTTIRRLFIRDFRRIIEAVDGDVAKAIIGMAERLAGLTDDAEAKDTLLGLALDGYAALEDYRQALAMVDAGFRNDNQEWRAVIVPKLRAHLAMKEGRTEEAIGCFREFMRAAAAAEQRPGEITLNQTLGMNAARIGDLWRGMGETEKAMVAYEEALTHYNGALEDSGASSDGREHIEEQLSLIAEKLAEMQ